MNLEVELLDIKQREFLFCFVFFQEFFEFSREGVPTSPDAAEGAAVTAVDCFTSKEQFLNQRKIFWRWRALLF